MELEKAKQIAAQVVEKLHPYCERITVAGSIRRQKPFVHDIDLVVIPNSPGQFIAALQSLGAITMGGSKLIRCQHPEIMLDVYIAEPSTWATLLLIRTGSAKHNIMLCSKAKVQGMKLHADGSGLFKVETCATGTPREDRIAGDTEQSIFEALGIPYKEPALRD